MNSGGRLDDAIHGVSVPARLADLPYLQPVYDEPEFIVRNVWRLYGGWWDGNPASLKPARERELAAELAALAGGARALADRALELAGLAAEQAAGITDPAAALRLAGHLAELAWLAAPGDSGIAEVRRRVFTARADAATSTMASGIFRWAAREPGRAGAAPAVPPPAVPVGPLAPPAAPAGRPPGIPPRRTRAGGCA